MVEGFSGPAWARETKAVYNSTIKQITILANLLDLCKIKTRVSGEAASVALLPKTQLRGKTRKRRVFQSSLKSKIFSSMESLCKGSQASEVIKVVS